jgi:S-formylglutathione hydrolase FrmB
VAIRALNEPPGAPWERPLRGRLDRLTVESELLAGNPLGDPARRPLYVYSSPGVVAGSATDVASVYMLQGFSGQLDAWLSRTPFELNTLERFDALFGDAERPCPEAVIVFVDAWTSLGGSQFLNSSANGRYLDYVCDEIVPFIDGHYPTAAQAPRRGVAGKSSGGYGAMVLPMLRPDVFGALASHAGDALFENCYPHDFPQAARVLRDRYDGSYERFLEAVRAAETFDWGSFAAPLNAYAMAAAYSPDPDQPGKVMLPFELRTGRLIEEIWELWLAHDPVRMAPRYAEALRGLKFIYLDAGRSDEYFLDLGAQAFSDELSALDVAHSFDLFDGRHGGIAYRYPVAVRALLQSLAPSS